MKLIGRIVVGVVVAAAAVAAAAAAVVAVAVAVGVAEVYGADDGDCYLIWSNPEKRNEWQHCSQMEDGGESDGDGEIP